MANFLNPDRIYNANGVTVKEYLLTSHNPQKIALPPKRTKALIGITIHNTESIAAAKGTTMSEQYTRATINGNMGDVRVHFYVDDKEAWQNLPLDFTGWHAADGQGNGNTATIAIEVIGNSVKAEENAARLTAYLLDKYKFTVKNVYTHSYWLNVKDGKLAGTKAQSFQDKDILCTMKRYDKNCPLYIIPHWHGFLKAVEGFNTKKVVYSVQVGAFSSKENAERKLSEVKKVFPEAFIKTN